jgi:hypothetical protein
MLRIEKEQLVKNWNKKYIPGQKVKVIVNGAAIVTTTRSNAELLGGHTPAIWLNNVSGCYALDRVSPLTDNK